MCYFILACRAATEKSANNLMWVSLYITCYFSLVAFNIFSLALTFVNLIIMHLSSFILEFILSGTLHFLNLGDYFLLLIREIFNYYLFKYFLWSFLSSPSGITIKWMLVDLIFSQRCLDCFHFFSSLFFLSSCGSDLHHSVFKVTYCPAC